MKMLVSMFCRSSRVNSLSKLKIWQNHVNFSVKAANDATIPGNPFPVSFPKSPRRAIRNLKIKTDRNMLGTEAHLKHLLNLCTVEKKALIATEAMEYCQYRAYDFSEEIAALFIKVCLTANDDNSMWQVFNNPDNRLGAYLSRSTCKQLLAHYKHDAKHINMLLALLHAKGIANLLVTKQQLKGMLIELATVPCEEKDVQTLRSHLERLLHAVDSETKDILALVSSIKIEAAPPSQAAPASATKS